MQHNASICWFESILINSLTTFLHINLNNLPNKHYDNLNYDFSFSAVCVDDRRFLISELEASLFFVSVMFS